MILVTGATGHLGNVLVKKLIEKGEKVKVLILPGESVKPLENISVERVYGDITDVESLKIAFTGSDIIIHLASLISILPWKKKLLKKVNVEGTKNVIDAAKYVGAKKLIYVSSIHAFKDVKKGRVIDESVEISEKKAIGDYGKTKAEATKLVLKANSKNFSTIVICPTGIIGPYDYVPSRMGKMIIDYLKGKIPFKFDGAYDFVDVRDVAEGIIKTLKSEKAGELYIFSGYRVTIGEIVENLEKILKKKVAKITIPVWVLYFIAPFSMLYGFIFKKEPYVTFESVYILMSNSNISSRKAKNEIGYSVRSFKDTLLDTIIWFKELGYLSDLVMI